MTTQRQVIEKILASKLSDKVKNSIKSRIRIMKDKGCWIVSKDWSHYSGKLHRHSYEVFVGPLKFGQEICHHCDRKGCFNPEHLFQGTHSDNMRDARNKERSARLNRSIVKRKMSDEASNEYRNRSR